MKRLTQCIALSPFKDISLFYYGPSLQDGPLPSLFYFTLSGKDSFTIDPINQPIQFLKNRPFRFFSASLPGHELNFSSKELLILWAQDIKRGIDPFAPFLDRMIRVFDYCIDQKWTHPQKIALMGLSRGAFAAFHLAARYEAISYIVSYAPLIILKNIREFSELSDDPIFQKYDLFKQTDALAKKHIRLYLGNRDTLIGTDHVFAFARAIIEKAYNKKMRSPQIEMIITPSIGRYGHGTSLETYRDGAIWVDHCLSIGS